MVRGLRKGQPYLKRCAQITIYLEPYEKTILYKYCKDGGFSMSTYIRSLLRRDLSIKDT